MKRLLRKKILVFILTTIGIFPKVLLPFLSILLLTACQKDQLEIKSPPPNSEVAAISNSIMSLNANTPNTLQVSGTIVEEGLQFVLTNNGITYTATNTWTGSLTGRGHVHIFSNEIIDWDNAIYRDIISKRFLFTPNGNLFFSEVGQSNGDPVVTSIVTGGTGIYKNATGQLILIGIHTEVGVNFTYSGSNNINN